MFANIEVIVVLYSTVFQFFYLLSLVKQFSTSSIFCPTLGAKNYFRLINKQINCRDDIARRQIVPPEIAYLEGSANFMISHSINFEKFDTLKFGSWEFQSVFLCPLQHIRNSMTICQSWISSYSTSVSVFSLVLLFTVWMSVSFTVSRLLIEISFTVSLYSWSWRLTHTTTNDVILLKLMNQDEVTIFIMIVGFTKNGSIVKLIWSTLSCHYGSE